MSPTDMIRISLYSEGPSTYITAGKWLINGGSCITLHTKKDKSRESGRGIMIPNMSTGVENLSP